MKKVILFDNDGVLVETEYWYYQANKRALGELGVEFSMDLYLDNMSLGISSWEIARERGMDDETIKQGKTTRNRYYQAFLKAKEIEIEGVEETLKALATDYRMAIVTTSKRVDFDLIHQQRNLIQYMDFVLTSEDYENAKPHPEPYLKALNKFGVRKEEAVVVEDSARGLKSALAAGIDCVVVHNDFTASHNFSGAMTKIKKLTELHSLLKAIR